MITTAGFRNGLKMLFDGAPHVIVEFQHVKPGKGPAFIRTKLKNLVTGAIFDHKFRGGERVQPVTLDDRDVTFTYREGDVYVFMDSESYEEFRLVSDALGDATNWLTEGLELSIQFYEGRPLTVMLPTAVELTVTKTDPGLKGDTATGGTKPATVETGAVVSVPLFINEGDKVRIDTRTGAYVTRVKE
ncbi:MAG TPA: elongation factor P [Candidatus Coatesbacteria bacterium]|nr:elongation factor P [Candidatus Coatesbacteria bacterium]